MTRKTYPLRGWADGTVTLELVADVTYLYELSCSHALPLYVGITDHLATRLAEHAREKAWWPTVDLAQVSVFRNRAAAKRAESWHIQCTGPMHNLSESQGYPYQDGPDFIEAFLLSRDGADGWRSAHFGRLNPSAGPLWTEAPTSPPPTLRQLLGMFGAMR